MHLAETYFDDENQTNRVVCIISDGEDHGANALTDTIALVEVSICRIFATRQKYYFRALAVCQSKTLKL